MSLIIVGIILLKERLSFNKKNPKKIRARVQPDSSSSNQDTSISSSNPLSLVICDGFPVVT